MDYRQQIGKAAKLLDLKGDVHGAVAVLQAVLNDPGIENAIPQKMEALTFLVDLLIETGNASQARGYIQQVETMDLSDFEADLVQHHFNRLRELKRQLSDG